MNRINAGSEVKQTGNEHLNAYLKLRNKLRKTFPKGYQMVRLDTPHIDITLPDDGRRHPRFAQIETASLGEAYAGDPGASTA